MQGCSLADVGLVSEVSAYNEVDCKAMMEAVGGCGSGIRRMLSAKPLSSEFQKLECHRREALNQRVV